MRVWAHGCTGVDADIEGFAAHREDEGHGLVDSGASNDCIVNNERRVAALTKAAVVRELDRDGVFARREH